jgi:DNA-directed RNA polymerase subunit beta'
LDFAWHFRGGLSFKLSDVIVPPAKKEIGEESQEEVTTIMSNYNMGFITNNERYNQIIDIWTHTNSKLTKPYQKFQRSERV